MSSFGKPVLVPQVHGQRVATECRYFELSTSLFEICLHVYIWLHYWSDVCHITEGLVVTAVVIVVDEGGNCPFQLAISYLSWNLQNIDCACGRPTYIAKF